MAQRKAEAWLTSAVDNDSVASAIVLAESLRRTKTTRTIAVITSRHVSIENRVALRKGFDAVFCMDESNTPGGGDSTTCPQDIHAKIFAFSLRFFEKCVFVSANSMVLENADKLFEGKASLKTLLKNEDGSIDWSLFMFVPHKELYEHLLQGTARNGKVISENFMTIWLKNQTSWMKAEKIPNECVANFSINHASLQICEKTHAPIIQFVDVKYPMHEKMESLKRTGVGLFETFITNTWLEIFHQTASVILKNPMTAAPSPTACNFNGQIYKNEPIAIIGMSCRYPGANTLEEFWNMLYQGEEGVREAPAFRWTKEHSLRVTQQERKTNVGFLSTTVDEFDAKFFGVSPKEAAYMDPQARLLHEVLWESLEDSGIDPLSLYGTHTGIFTGSWLNDYKDIVQGSTEKDFFRTYMGNSIGAAAARLSFLLGLTGPSIATESGCSSAIVALDLAVKSLRNEESNLALAGGVNLLLHPFTSNIMDYVIAPNGRCKTFDANADGFGRAEGCGVLVLKRLTDALRDRDNIWAMIRGSAVSQEGLSRSLGTPTVHCEALSMQLALNDANVHPEQVSFVETHGTGTAVGDPMEVAAIAKAYYTPLRQSPLVIGSVKTNVGHTESCSGITGIMKTILAMQHELIPKHRNLESLNPEIFLDSIPAMIPLEPVAWPKVKGQPRIAGVSSFGITGTDGHVIIQEAPDYELPKFNLQLERPTHILKMSGKSGEALDELLKEYATLFSERAANEDETVGTTFGNAAYTANVGRATFSHRAFIVAQNYKEAAKIMAEKKYLQAELKDGENRQICFLFTGQGSQYQGMAKTLYETSPIFRINFDACDRTLRENYNLSIREVLWESDPSSNELSRTIYSQTSIFCVEYCLLKLWQSWGIHPDYVLGHSLGEFCAAVAAGILDFKDALKLVAERSRLIDSLPRGSMLVIKADKPEVEKLMKCAKMDLDFAAVNNPEQTVVAGDTDKIQELLTCVKGQGLKAITLEATHAFHSRHMDPMLDKYRKIAESIDFKKGDGNIKYVSGMEGRIVLESSELTADYWVRHTREKVSFLDACAALRGTGCLDFLEVGPQPVLSSFVMMNNEDLQLNCLPSLRRGADDWYTILTTLGKLCLLGYKINWKDYDEPYLRNKVSLPFHPFHRKSFWVESTSSNATLIHPLVGYSLNNASALNIFQNDLNVKSVPYVKDHCIGERIVFPGAGYTEMCLAAGYCVSNGLTETLDLPSRAMRLENLRIDAPLELKEGKPCRLQVIVDLPESVGNEQQQEHPDNQGFRVKVFHQNNSHEESGKWVQHASSVFIPVASTKEILKKWKPERISQITSAHEPETSEMFYKHAADCGLIFGETFRSMKRYWLEKDADCKMNQDLVVAEMKIPPDCSKYLLHPLIIDAAIQSGILATFRYDETKLTIPVRIGQLTVLPGVQLDENSGDALRLHAWLENGYYNIFVYTLDMSPVAFLENVEMIDTNVKTIESILEQQSSSIPDAWEEIWKVIPSPFSSAVRVVDVESILSDPEFLEKTSALSNNAAQDVDVHQKTERLLFLYILNALLELGWAPQLEEVITVKSLLKQLAISIEFRKLVRFYFTVLEQENYLVRSEVEEADCWRVCQLPPSSERVKMDMDKLHGFLKVTKASNVIAIYEYLASNLSKVLKGQESALALLFPLEEAKQQYSADSYYQNHPGRRAGADTLEITCKAIYQQSQLANENDPGKIYRVLEVGSGTGSLSKDMLTWLRDSWGDRFEFYYTDISQSFFVKAEKKLEEFNQNNIKYAVFNIEQSPLSQGIPLNYFDMVAATDVIHATRRLGDSLIHLRQTLRAGGVLLFTETVTAARDITFVFGLLEGYWRYEDYEWRQHHCCVGEDVWERLLNQSGFQSVHSFKLFFDQFSCISAVASPGIQVDALRPSLLPCEKESKLEQDEKSDWILFSEQGSLESLSQVVKMLNVSGNKVVIVQSKQNFLDNSHANDLLNDCVELRFVRVDEQDFSEIESLLVGFGGESKVQGVIYAAGMDINEKNQKNVALPLLHIAKALVGLRKPPQLYILTLGVHALNEDTVTCHPAAATLFGMAKSLKNENFDMFVRCVDMEQDSTSSDIANQVLYELAMSKGVREQQRVQVAYRNNLRLEPRLCKASLQTQSDELKLPPSTDRYQLVLPKSRVIQDLEFDVLEEEEVGDNEVEIKVKAYALNFKDILTVLKPSAEFEQLNTVGLDLSGVVTKASSKCGFKVGDRVFGANFKEGQLPSHLVLDSRCVLRIPDKMTFWEAATLPMVFTTAYHCLISIAKLKRGETVLIHTGSGGVGLAAIQVARYLGANIITTAGNTRKRAYLRSLGIEHVFQSRNTSFEKDILRVTNGRGVDVVLNSITGPGIKEATLNSSSKNARFVEMSKLSIWSPEEVKAMRPDVDYSVVYLGDLDNEEWAKLLDNLKQFLDKGIFKSIPYVKFDALNIRQALQHFQKAKHIGKIVCSMPNVVKQEGQFKVSVPLFNSESTYLITGGFGGIGFEVCKWMIKLGATDIVLTGRSPPKSDIAQQIDSLNERGFNVMVRLGDVGNYDQCHLLISEINKGMKPLRGIMHCAGVLRDNLYSKQTWDSFQATFTPKVSGTWNLHNLTTSLPLEHFILYSSVTALVGTPGQPNHAAANCFEDAFIHYRHSQGLPGSTVNWGQWAQVGCAKEISLSGVLPVSVKRMLNGLEMSLKAHKRQICFNEFDSFNNFSLLCPIIKSYLDERLWKQLSSGPQDSQCFKVDQFWKEMDDAKAKKDKIAVLAVYLKAILRTALRLEQDEPIQDDANIQELGVDSLMMLELKNTIQSLLGSRVNVTTALLKNCNTVRLIANSVVGKLQEEESEDEETPLDPLSTSELLHLLSVDCVLNDSIKPTTVLPLSKPSQIKTVLVTGCTGYLAPHLISQLSKNLNSVEKIVCLVRGHEEDPFTAAEKLKATLSSMNLATMVNMSKMESVTGDVALDNLGLSREKYNELCASVDAVIHCAVKNHPSEHYTRSENNRKCRDIRSVNVGGTVNVLKFACNAKTKHVFYPSTIVCGVWTGREEGISSDQWPELEVIESIVENKMAGLQASKFVCELLLKQANQRGIPCKVFRFPWIAGESKSGQLNHLNNPYLVRFLSFLKINAMPSLVLPANFLPVDMCAEFSLQLFFSDETPNEIFNVGHPQPQVEQEFVQLAKEEFGRSLEILDWTEFVQLIQNTDTGLDSLKELYQDERLMSMYMADAAGFVKGYLVSSDTFFKNHKVSKFIPNYEQLIPSSMEILRRDLLYLKSTGVFDKLCI